MRTLVVGLLLAGSIALAQQTPSFNLTVSGEKTWTIWLGLGSATVLADQNLTPGQPTLTQTLRAMIEGKALGFITLRASFNDQLDVGFQDFLLTVERTPWTGELGRFVVGAEGEGLGVYNKRVLGARVGYLGGNVNLHGLVTRLEGVSESRTFRGEQGRGEILFTVNDPDEPWREAPYLRSVEGLAHWPLRIQFVEGLTKVQLRVDGTLALWSFLADWGLDYIRNDLTAQLATPLTSGEYVVLRNERDDLALRVAPSVLARKRIQEAIEAHNVRLGLAGKDRKTYPFVEASELEGRFLGGFISFLAVLVDEDVYPFSDLARRRYLPLGERDVVEGSVEVWIRRPGESEFRPSTDPALAEYVWVLLPADGMLRIAFPSAFFAGGAIRATFAYHREGTTFSLGPSLVPGSERVALNGRRLTRGTDYSLDYTSGILLLFPSLGPDDELKVDFERQRGGLGVITDYERNLFGLILTIADWDGLRLALYRAMDLGLPRPTTHTMPNTHTVAALSASGKIAGWTYSLNLAGSENIFPVDDNARVPTPNRVHTIVSAQAPDGEYLILGHDNGLTVHKDGMFSGYGPAHGLAGRSVYAVLPLPGQLLVGTDAGLTVVRLTEPTPFDRVRSWVRVTGTERLPGTEVLALARGDGLVYLTTESVLVWFAVTDSEDPKKWETAPLPEDGGFPTALLWAEGSLYLGTSTGLYVGSAGLWTPVVEAAGAVHALLARGGDVYVASDHGIRILRGTRGVGWVVFGKAVYDLALKEGILWFAAEDGLWHEDRITPVVTEPATAVGAGQGAIWAAAVAREDFRLDLWRVTDRVERLPPSRTRIDGRDLGRFQDIPAADHTRHGTSASLALSQTVGDWQWEVRAASRLPGYEEIGRSGRSDGHGMSVAARYSGGPTAFALQARWDVIDLSTQPRGRLAAGLDWRWSDGPTATLSLTPTVTGDGLLSFRQLELGWQAGLSNKTQAWTWGVSITGTLRAPAPVAWGQLTGNVSLLPLPGWTMDLSWTRPFRTIGAPGSETFRAVLRWATETDRLSLSASWQEEWRHHLTGDTWRDERTLQGDARWKAWSITGGSLTPRLSATVRLSPTEQRWSARGEADVARAPNVVRVKVLLGQGFLPVTERSDRTLGLSAYWETTAWEGVRASLQWDRSWITLSHPRYPTQTTDKEEVALRVTWEPKGAGWRDTLTLTWKPRDQQTTLSNRLTWVVGTSSLASETSASLKGEALDVKTTAQLGLPLDAVLVALGAEPIGDMWGLSAEVGHIVALKGEAEPKHALFLGVTLAVRF